MKKTVLSLSLVSTLFAETADFDPLTVTDKEEGSIQLLYTIHSDVFEKHTAMSLLDALETSSAVNSYVGSSGRELITLHGHHQKRLGTYYDEIPLQSNLDGEVMFGNFSNQAAASLQIQTSTNAAHAVDSMGGAILITPRIPEKPLHGSFNMLADETGRKDASLFVGTKNDHAYTTLSLTYGQSDGYKLSDAYDKSYNENGNQRENSDFIKRNASLRSGYITDSGNHFALDISHNENAFGLPPYTYDDTTNFITYARFDEWKLSNLYLIGDTSLGEHFLLKTRLFYSNMHNTLDAYDDISYTTQSSWRAFRSHYDDTLRGIRMIGEYQHERHDLTFSLTSKHNEHREYTDFLGSYNKRTEIVENSLSVDDTIGFDNSTLSVGLLYAENENTYADGLPTRDKVAVWNPNLAFQHDLDNTLLFASAAKKTRFPSAAESINHVRFAWETLNTELKTEQASVYEAGLRKPFGHASEASLSLFYSDITDLIVFQPADSTYRNIEKGRHSGFDLRFRSPHPHDGDLDIGYTFLEAKDGDDHPLPDTSTHQFIATERIELAPDYHLTLSAQHLAGRYSLEGNSLVRLDDYTKGDMDIRYRLSGENFFKIGVRNISDANCEYAYGYPAEGRMVFTSLNLSY